MVLLLGMTVYSNILLFCPVLRTAGDTDSIAIMSRCLMVFSTLCYRRISMVKSLLAPYENRAWAQTNWILARLWKVLFTCCFL